uniref:Uncharacterized protein n=1 Tax=Aureoumbra lagunensis TaxID=44058 RepID=A0A7S3NPP1_9STRA
MLLLLRILLSSRVIESQRQLSSTGGLLSVTSVGAKDVFTLYDEEWQADAATAWQQLRREVRKNELNKLENWINDDFDYIRKRAKYRFEAGDWIGLHRTLGPIGSKLLPRSLSIDIQVSPGQKNGTRALCAMLRIGQEFLTKAENVEKFALSTFFRRSIDNVFRAKTKSSQISTIEIDCIRGPSSSNKEKNQPLRRCVLELARHPKLTQWFTTTPERIAQFAKKLKKIVFVPTGFPASLEPYLQPAFDNGTKMIQQFLKFQEKSSLQTKKSIISLQSDDLTARKWIKHFPNHFISFLPKEEQQWLSIIAQSPFLALGKDSQRLAVLSLALGVMPILGFGSSSLRLFYELPHALVQSDHLQVQALVDANTILLHNATSFKWQFLSKSFWLEKFVHSTVDSRRSDHLNL